MQGRRSGCNERAAGERLAHRGRTPVDVVRLGVVILGLAALLLAAKGSVAASAAAWSRLAGSRPGSADVRFDQMESVRRELRAAVPAGSRVYVEPSVATVWRQLVTEFAYLQGATVTHDIRQADFLVTVSQQPGATPRLSAERLRPGQA